MKTTLKLGRRTAIALPLIMAGSFAAAGGLSEPVETVAPAPVATPAPAPMMGSDWTGFYAGAQLGYGDLTISAIPDNENDGAIYGVHGGYMYDFGTIVAGAEFDYDLTDITIAELGTDVDSIMRIKGRVGYDAGAFLPYATAGVVRASLDNDTETDGDFYGLGAAYKFNDNILVGGEVLQHKFYEGDAGVQGLGVRATTATARVSFQF